MRIDLECPSCGVEFELNEREALEKTICPNCEQHLLVEYDWYGDEDEHILYTLKPVNKEEWDGANYTINPAIKL